MVGLQDQLLIFGMGWSEHGCEERGGWRWAWGGAAIWEWHLMRALQGPKSLVDDPGILLGFFSEVCIWHGRKSASLSALPTDGKCTYV